MSSYPLLKDNISAMDHAMFFLFASHFIRAEHVSSLSTVHDRGEGSGSTRYEVTVSLINGDKISSYYASAQEASQAFYAIKTALGA